MISFDVCYTKQDLEEYKSRKHIEGFEYSLGWPTVFDKEQKSYLKSFTEQGNKLYTYDIIKMIVYLFPLEEAKKYFYSIFGLSGEQITECLRGNRKTSMNMHFEYFQTDIDYPSYAPKRIKELGGRNDFVKCLESGIIYSSRRNAEKGEGVFREQIRKSLERKATFAGKTWVMSSFNEWFEQEMKKKGNEIKKEIDELTA